MGGGGLVQWGCCAAAAQAPCYHHYYSPYPIAAAAQASCYITISHPISRPLTSSSWAQKPITNSRRILSPDHYSTHRPTTNRALTPSSLGSRGP